MQKVSGKLARHVFKKRDQLLDGITTVTAVEDDLKAAFMIARSSRASLRQSGEEIMRNMRVVVQTRRKRHCLELLEVGRGVGWQERDGGHGKKGRDPGMEGERRGHGGKGLALLEVGRGVAWHEWGGRQGKEGGGGERAGSGLRLQAGPAQLAPGSAGAVLGDIA